MPWGLTLSFSPPCWKENLWYSFQQVCQKRTKVCPTKNKFLPLAEKKIFDILFSKCDEKMFVKAVQICLQILSTKFLYPNLCFVYRICHENLSNKCAPICHKICPEFITKICPQILSTRSANLSTIITNLFQSVYSVSRNLSTKESTNL